MKCTFQHIDSKEVKIIDSFFDMVSCEQIHKKDFIVPDGTPGLLYVQKGVICRTHIKGKDIFTAGDLILFGQKTSSVTYHLMELNTQAIGYKLMPYAIHQLFGISACTLTDDFIRITDLPTKVNMLSHLMLGKVPHPLNLEDNQLHEVAYLIEKINDSMGLTPVRNLIQDVGKNYKYIERLFKKHVGITPKIYARIIRFNYGFKHLQNSNYNLTDIAYQCGYFDQNHFIKEIKYFTQLTPKALFDFDNSGVEESHLRYIRMRAY